MKTVGAYEAKTHLPRLLNEVADGEEVTITKHGVPVARLVPLHLDGSEKLDARAAVEDLQRFRKEHGLDAITFWELMEEGKHR